MSWITNVVLSFSVGEDTEERVSEVNRFFENVPDKYKGGSYEDVPLASVEPVWDGKGHGLECNLYIGAYNYFPLEDFIMHLRSAEWEMPEDVQLFVQDQEDSKFQLINVIMPEAEGEPEPA